MPSAKKDNADPPKKATKPEFKAKARGRKTTPTKIVRGSAIDKAIQSSSVETKSQGTDPRLVPTNTPRRTYDRLILFQWNCEPNRKDYFPIVEVRHSEPSIYNHFDVVLILVLTFPEGDVRGG